MRRFPRERAFTLALTAGRDARLPPAAASAADLRRGGEQQAELFRPLAPALASFADTPPDALADRVRSRLQREASELRVQRSLRRVAHRFRRLAARRCG